MSDDHVVIIHRDLGIYIGHMGGKRYWSGSCQDGFDVVLTWATYEEAVQHVSSWRDGSDLLSYEFKFIRGMRPGQRIATIAHLRAAGLDGLLGTLPFAKEWAQLHYQC